MSATLTLASASGNSFAYLRSADVPVGFDGGLAARRLCPHGDGLGLDGLFLVSPFTPGKPWILEHWDPDGGRTFCSNGTRAATALLPMGFQGALEVHSSGERVSLRVGETVGLRLPDGPGYGLQPPPDGLAFPAIFGWTGTPHLVLEVPKVDDIDFPSFAPPLRYHRSLPEGANITLLQVDGPGRGRIRSWERGIEGETLCCGQGASVAGAWLSHRTGISHWTLQPRGRDSVSIEADLRPDGSWEALWLSGPVQRLGELCLGPDLPLG